MDENAVRTIVMDERESYEQTFGRPRHEENLANFKKLFDFVATLKGISIAGGVVVGVPSAIASAIVILKTLRGH